MIGVACKRAEREIVREFFELFKTPWEFLLEGRNYDMVISTLDEMPKTNSGLLIIFSSTPVKFDELGGISIDSVTFDHDINHKGIRFPIYGRLLRLRGKGHSLYDYSQSNSGPVVLKLFKPHRKVIRVGYDLFSEVAFLLSQGQSVENALIPTLEAHIALLRDWITEAGIPVVEVPPVPWGHSLIACLTHDVDFAGIRQHKFDNTFWGFVYRAVAGSVIELFRSRGSLARLIRNWMAVISLPLVYLGLLKDFWDQFERYAEIDRNFSSTFFLIPFRDRSGDRLQGRLSGWRATHYDIGDVQRQVKMLAERGYEIGLHGIDAWHSVERGRQELRRIVETTGQQEIGVRMHWLYLDHQSSTVLEEAGFEYDSTFGYNETVGYRAGTLQVFRPLGATHLLELPLHIQDTALFTPRRMALSEGAAWDLCRALLDEATCYGGVVTVLWHLRSLAPERCWGEFYTRLLQELRDRGAWFGTARQVVDWFRRRRSVVFEESSFSGDKVRLRLKYGSHGLEPPLFLRVHKPHRSGSRLTKQASIDIPLTGQSSVEISLDQPGVI